MATIEEDTLVIDQDTFKLQGFRLEDTIRAPAIIIFVDDRKPELIPLSQHQVPPIKIKSRNMEAEIQVISYDEISSYMHP
jgi:hypothetical protein